MTTEIHKFGAPSFPIEAVLTMEHGRYELSLTTLGHPEITIFNIETNEHVSEVFPADLRGLKDAIAKLESLDSSVPEEY